MFGPSPEGHELTFQAVRIRAPDGQGLLSNPTGNPMGIRPNCPGDGPMVPWSHGRFLEADQLDP